MVLTYMTPKQTNHQASLVICRENYRLALEYI